MLVSAENMAFGFAGSPLLEKIDFTLSEGDRVGLIGPNGEGKTTLIRLILSELEPEDGRIFVKNGIRIGYLAQNGGYDSENTVFEEMKEIFAEDIRALDSLRETEKKIAAAEEGSDEYRALSGKYEALNKLIAARDSYRYEIRIRTVLNGMGFSEFYNQRISTMSGGEKTMTAIALMFAVLKTKPTPFCILDEVEAALDDANIDRFANYLKNFHEIQFAVVTHQKVTMEHADVLYGVTMPEQGISKVISLRLGDDFDL